jgi:hypothetical protein
VVNCGELWWIVFVWRMLEPRRSLACKIVARSRRRKPVSSAGATTPEAWFGDRDIECIHFQSTLSRKKRGMLAKKSRYTKNLGIVDSWTW